MPLRPLSEALYPGLITQNTYVQLLSFQEVKVVNVDKCDGFGRNCGAVKTKMFSYSGQP